MSRPPDRPTEDATVAEARRQRTLREQGYRAQALKLFPWVCGHCGREFDARTLHQLTVHHKDHNHEHNPPDGSNWELLCVYCHDNEHAQQGLAAASAAPGPGADERPTATHRPFADLADRLKRPP